jgi:hypothetical protein
MDKAQKLTLLEDSLTRAAEQLGDITPLVMDRYYADFPDARASFDRHGLGKTVALEGEMVENCLYCLMTCLDRPMEIEIMLDTSVPHHQDTLDVPLSWYQGLVDATIAVVAETIPPERADEHAVWAEIQAVLGAIFDGCRLCLPVTAPTA